MAPPPKKQELMAEVESAESEDHSDVEEQVNMNNEIVNCELDGRNPEDTDFHGIKLLLQQLFLKAHVNISELTDLIIGQNFVGSVIKQSYDENEEEDEDEEDENNPTVFGITTVINLTDKQNLECVSQLRTLLMDLCTEHGTEQSTAMVHSILSDDSKPLGLVINERIINISPKVSVPLLESLMSEMRRAHEKKKSRFDFSYYVFICKIKKIEGKALKKKTKKKNKGLGLNTEQEIFWENGEEEIIDEEAECRFEFNVKDESDSGLGGKWTEDDTPMTPYRRVLILPAAKLPAVLARIKDAVAFDPSCLLLSRF